MIWQLLVIFVDLLDLGADLGVVSIVVILLS